jgi:DeoR/GlpR family transcriptional regulator of sugar metabolism
MRKTQARYQLSAERYEYILGTLKSNGRVLSTELSQELNVSEDTIRRDLSELASQGRIKRVHGGALPIAPSISFEERHKTSGLAKHILGKHAAKFIKSGQLIIMDGGTTVLEIAKHISPDVKSTVVTNSPPLAGILATHPHIDIILLGGQLLKSSQVTVGVDVIEQLSSIHADLCFLGTCSLHPKLGLGASNFDEMKIKKAIMKASAEVIALATSDKLTTALPYIVAPAKQLNYLITDVSDKTILKPYQNLGITVQIVS